MAIQIPPADAGPSRPPYKLAHTIAGHTRSVTALRFSNDGKLLVSAGEHQRSLRAHRTGINDITLSPDSRYVATASDDGTSTIHTLYPLPSEALPQNILNHGILEAEDEATPGLGLSSTTASSGTATATATAIATPLRLLSSHTAPILSIAFSPTSNLLATGSFDESAIVWDVRRGAVLRRMPAHAEAVWCVGWDGEGGVVITGSGDGLIHWFPGPVAHHRRLWDAHSGQCLRTFDNDSSSPVAHACFTPSSTYILSTTLSSTLRIYNIHTSKVLRTFQHPSYTAERYPCPSVIFAKPRNETTGNAQSSISESATTAGGEPVQVPQKQRSLGQHEDAWVVAGSENGHVVIWDVATKALIADLSGPISPVIALAVHPDGRRIATGTLEPEKTVRLWEYEEAT